MRVLKCIYFILYDTLLAPIFGHPYWKSNMKKWGAWRDYWFLTADLSDKE